MIFYRKLRKYEYVLAKDFYVSVDLPGSAVTPFLGLSNGRLTIRAGYAWDGPSGPAIDTKTFMRGSLVHDALYQLMREGHLSGSCREYADDLLRKLCLDDGMSKLRAWWVYHGVRLGGGPHAKSDLESAP